MVVAWLYYSVPLVWVCFYGCGMLLVFAMVLELFCHGVNMVLLGCCCGVGDVVLLWL